MSVQRSQGSVLHAAREQPARRKILTLSERDPKRPDGAVGKVVLTVVFYADVGLRHVCT